MSREISPRSPLPGQNDKSFDAPARIEEARSLASELAAGTSAERLDTDQASAIDLRDRAFTYLDARVSALREAGRYAFRDDDDIRRRFASRFLRRKNRKAKGAVAETPEVPTL